MAISEAEKIRKAEEIYYRRNGIKIDNKEEKKSNIFINFFKKIITLSLILCAIIAYLNKDYVTSEDFQTDLRELMNTKIDIKNIWDSFTESKENNEQNKKIEEKKEEIDPLPEAVKENNKSEFTYIFPLNGEITSGFGYRESENPNVVGNHTGIDIAGNIGDKILSSSYGKVIEVSAEGAYGNHLKIENNNIIMLYAHCNEIYVSEGDEVTQGEEIAEVGMTGNTTGPHLHFEIRENNEPVDPTQYLNPQ